MGKKRITFGLLNSSYMSKPKSTYSFRLSDKTIKQVQYLGHKLRVKGETKTTLTTDLERAIDKLFNYAKQGPQLFD